MTRPLCPARPRLAALVPLLGLIAIAAGRATAQSAAQVTAVATVPLPMPTGAGVRNLDFGAVVPGGSSLVAPTIEAQPGVQAGWFKIQVGGLSEFSYSVALPAVLISHDGQQLAVSFDGNHASECTVDAGDAVCATLEPFNPLAEGAARRLCHYKNNGGQCVRSRRFAAGSEAWILIGGRVDARPDQPRGTYTGTVTLRIDSQF